MKKGLIVLVVFLLSASLVYGQAHRTADKALLFEFDGLDNLGVDEFYGGLGIKIMMSSVAVRTGITFGSYSSEDIHQEPNVGDKDSEMEFGLNLDLLYYLAENRVAPYIGVGFGFNYYKYKEEDAHDIEDQTYGEYEASGFGLGVGLLLGAEVFVVKNLSLSGEYQIGFMSDSATSPSDSGQDYKKGSSMIGIQTSGTLTLSVYF